MLFVGMVYAFITFSFSLFNCLDTQYYRKFSFFGSTMYIYSEYMNHGLFYNSPSIDL